MRQETREAQRQLLKGIAECSVGALLLPFVMLAMPFYLVWLFFHSTKDGNGFY